MQIKTNRLIIRPVTMADKAAVFEYRSDAETNKYQGWIPKTMDDVEQFIGKISSRINVPETWFQLVIIESETQNIVGDIGIHFMDTENKQTEIGCTLNKNFQHKGYATEALTEVINYLFETLNKHRVIASIDPDNQNSIHLVERIGFRKEAHFIKSLLINDEWVDDLVYALIETDWNEIKRCRSVYGDPASTATR